MEPEPSHGDIERRAPRRNWDGYAAVIATLIGLLALVVSGYTAYVQRQQLRAQVWPHLSIRFSNTRPHVRFMVVNGGTGPARVTAVRVTVDKRLVKTWNQAETVMGEQPGSIVTSQFSGSVIPADKELEIVAPFDEATTERFLRSFLGDRHAIDVTACYCSVLDECWVVTSDTVSAPIASPDDCPIPLAERFRQ